MDLGARGVRFLQEHNRRAIPDKGFLPEAGVALTGGMLRVL